MGYNLYMRDKKLRLLYVIGTLLLLVTEVLIALFVHDSIIRPFIGDMLVVILIGFFVRIFIPRGVKILPLPIFLFAIVIEILQYYDIAGVLGFKDNRFMSVLIGGTFDLHDIVCYAIGCVVLFLIEILIRQTPLYKRNDS